MKREQAIAHLERQLPELYAAVAPTKSDVFMTCGSDARNTHDAITSLLARLRKLEEALERADRSFFRIEREGGKIKPGSCGAVFLTAAVVSMAEIAADARAALNSGDGR